MQYKIQKEKYAASEDEEKTANNIAKFMKNAHYYASIIRRTNIELSGLSACMCGWNLSASSHCKKQDLTPSVCPLLKGLNCYLFFVVRDDVLPFYPSAYYMMQCAGEIESRLAWHAILSLHLPNKSTNSSTSPKYLPLLRSYTKPSKVQLADRCLDKS